MASVKVGQYIEHHHWIPPLNQEKNMAPFDKSLLGLKGIPAYALVQNPQEILN